MQAANDNDLCPDAARYDRGECCGGYCVPANAGALRFLSVCSGIEAASVAWPQWQAVAFAEIEKFPSAVLAHHYPNVPNLGDFTKIDTASLGRVDILCGGTPCQAFSVAGARRSLDDDRGNLTLAFVGLAHELADGNGLRNVIWENVPGVLSTKDNAFGCFLAALVGADGACVPVDPQPVSGRSNRRWGWSAKERRHYIKWPRYGVVVGPKGRAAWAVKDAQYFGLAQRRERVVVVADFGNGADPAAVLFEPEGVCRDSPPSRETREGVAGAAKGGAGGCGGLGTDFDLGGWLVETAVAYGGNRTSGPIDVATAVNAHGGPHGRLDFESETFVCVHGTQDPCTSNDTAFALGRNSGGENVIAFSAKDYGADASTDLAPTLRAGGHTTSHANAGVMPAVCTVALRGRDGGATAELGGDVATALRASSGGGDRPHVLTSAVRRLTPRECERLQGFPDDYTRIPWRGKPAEQCPDGPRYKALGNSWAVPLFAWLGARIARLMPRTATNDNTLPIKDRHAA